MQGRPVEIKLNLKRFERESLKKTLSNGRFSARVFKRARTLQLFDEGKSASACAEAVGIGEETARRIAKRYLGGGLDRALYDLPRPGADSILDSTQEARIVAMVCSKPPEGFARWSISLIVREAISRKLVEAISNETIRRLLHRREIKPWREKNVVRTRIE